MIGVVGLLGSLNCAYAKFNIIGESQLLPVDQVYQIQILGMNKVFNCKKKMHIQLVCYTGSTNFDLFYQLIN